MHWKGYRDTESSIDTLGQNYITITCRASQATLGNYSGERKEAEGKQLEVKRYSDDVMQKNAWLS